MIHFRCLQIQELYQSFAKGMLLTQGTCISTEMADDVMNSCWCAAVNFRVRALAETILIEQM